MRITYGARQPIILMMTRLVIFLAYSTLLLLPGRFINGQDCPIVEKSDLGSTSTPSSVGLLPDTLAAAGLSNSIQIIDFNIVCLVQAQMKNEYTSISVIVRYFRDLDSMVADVQVEFQCSMGQWSAGNNVRMDPIATLNSTIALNCILCFEEGTIGSLVVDDNHCAGELVHRYYGGLEVEPNR
jgi:hypothetical protein